MSVLIGLNGRKGAGKDTAFHQLHQWAEGRGVRASRGSFADALKLSFARLFLPDCSREEAVSWCDRLKFTGRLTVEDSTLHESGQISTLAHEISGRVALQRYGTESHRELFGEDFWVDQLLPINDTPDSYVHNFTRPLDFGELPDICVVTDVRFANEAQRVIDLGGTVWEIHRKDDARSSDSHLSEAPLPRELIGHRILNPQGRQDLLLPGLLAAFRAEYPDYFKDIIR